MKIRGRDYKRMLKIWSLQGFQNGVPILFQRETLTFCCTRKKSDPQQQWSKNNPHFVNRLYTNACYTNNICIADYEQRETQSGLKNKNLSTTSIASYHVS